MRLLHALSGCALLGSALLGGCRFQVSGIGTQSIVTDLSFDATVASDGSPADSGGDVQPYYAPDLATDFNLVVDLASVDFETRPFDLATADLTTNVPSFPSHLPSHYLSDSAADWNIVENTTIDTSPTPLTITTPTPSGLVTAVESAYAVIAVNTMTLGTEQQPNVRVTVVGSRPLIIVAGTSITIYGLLDAGGHAGTPGPGGSAPGSGGGIGGTGSGNRSGGGGAGYGTNGGTGGASPSTAAGGTYGSADLSGVNKLAGGSGGGAGAAAGSHQQSCTTPATGGAGGGALQLTSRSITLAANGTNSVNGIISVAGGGATGGCAATDHAGGGGGGGSGGGLLIEAPTLTLSGKLDAAGGGGGGGGSVGNGHMGPGGGNGFNGIAGYDGLVSQVTQLSSRGGLGFDSGGSGYNGFQSATPSAGGGATSTTNQNGEGGGGGGGGRICVRSHSSITPTATPTADNVTTLPASIP